MGITVFLIIGPAAAGLIVWFLAKAHSQSALAKKLLEIEGRGKGAEAVINELRQQIQQKNSEINQIRNELDSERRNRVESSTRLEASQKSLAEQRELFETVKKEMADTFNALSSAALKNSGEDFLRLASENLGKIVAETRGRLGEHQTAIDGMIRPLHETLGRYREELRGMEESRHKAYGGLTEQLRALASTHESLQKETSNLVSALRKPHVRGRWGEMQLRRVAELSGMSMHCDFTEQETRETESGRIRPDMVVHLPMGRKIVVDSKVPLEAYLDAVNLSPEDARIKMARHSQHIRTHINKLASKEYWTQFEESPEFVILFIPGEAFLSAALEVDGTILEDGIQKKVIVATPTTFIALLRAIAYGWRQEEVSKNAEEISALGKELYERISTLAGHFEELGDSIGKAVTNYNRVVGSMEARVLPSVRRFKELGATGAPEIPPLEHVDQTPRALDADLKT